LDGENILVTDENGKIIDLVPAIDGGENVEIYNGIISPGFVNAHCHLELSHLKNKIPEKTGLIDFVFKVVSERYFAEEEILNAIEKIIKWKEKLMKAIGKASLPHVLKLKPQNFLQMYFYGLQ